MISSRLKRLLRTFLVPPSKRRHALVGPLHLWKMKRDFQIAFLRQAGLRPTHYLLDLGCGTLRGGIPIIRYLEAGHYYGVESRAEVLAEGLRELREAGLEKKAPVLLHSERLSDLELSRRFDYVWAFSVLIHMPDEVLAESLRWLSTHLQPDGQFFANVNAGAAPDGEWQGFPIVFREVEFYRKQAHRFGLEMEVVGTLGSLGHRSGVKAQDEQIMLRFQLRP
ncbi:MAG: class I SAM-dependent methyltransferase [Calditrichaeota bacterium]|nr:MAG: class I SAM-dependent methyltransferase [Calditrichota bacterium]